MQKKKHIYFASDFHFGIPNTAESKVRETKFIQWLEEIKHDASEIFLLGDLFDFWFEYKTVVPKGYVRVLGKIAELSDAGIKIHLFTGNNDMWIFNYLPQELGATLYRNPIKKVWNNKTFFIGHGDGLGPGDHGYKFIKKVFANAFCQWLFARLHPNFGIWLAHFFSGKSRAMNLSKDAIFLGNDKEWLVKFCREELNKEHSDYFIFGHRHLPLDIPLNQQSRYINLGDWISHFTYAVFDGEKLELKKYN